MVNRLATVFAVAGLLLAGAVTLEARTKKGEKLHEQAKKAEALENWDEALDLYQQAVAEDPSDSRYTLSVRRTRFQTGQFHAKQRQDLRKAGKLDAASRECP
ncbi:MAG: hypothetical protein GY953_26935, partial [bacterium]|nr:hypothetical protein [bacterium]